LIDHAVHILRQGPSVAQPFRVALSEHGRAKGTKLSRGLIWNSGTQEQKSYELVWIPEEHSLLLMNE
jgi:hypothetical protein